MKKRLIIGLAALLAAFVLAGCGAKGSGDGQSDSGKAQSEGQGSAEDKGAQDENAIDYLVLVNKLNKLPDDWEDKLQTEHFTNSVGDDVEVEVKAYAAYLELKEDLEKEGIHVDLDSARRSVDEQQRIVDDFTQKYGEDYTAKTVAVPGYSEHHTGLALDLYLIVDGKDIVENEDMIKYTDIWAKIHEKLPEHGFILRYLEGKEHITGYGYEPWHIRYVDDPDVAKEITEKCITLETYLGKVTDTDVELDYNMSDLYTEEQLKEMMTSIKCDFATWEGCELHVIHYAGDACNSEEHLKWLNSLDNDKTYTKAAEFLLEFKSPDEEGGAWEPNKEYMDYQWWLASDNGEDWDNVSTGY